MDLKQWLKASNAWFLGVSDQTHVPGYLYEKKKSLVGASSFAQYGQAWTRLGREKADFASTRVAAGVATGSWSRTFDADINVGLKQFGVSVKGGLRSVRSVTVEASGITAAVLDDAKFDPGMLASELRKVVDRGDIYLAFRMLYADSYVMRFQMSGAKPAKIAIDPLNVDFGGDFTWTTDNTITLPRGDAPFAFIGPRI